MTRIGLARFIAVRLAVYTGIAYLTAGVFFTVIQARLIFPAPDAYSAITSVPGGLRFEDLQIPVNASDHLHAWWIPAAQPSRMTVLMFHGNAETLGDVDGEQLDSLHDLGANLLAVDYRGYGSSTKVTPDESTINADARAALDELTRRRNIPVNDVIILGRSVGTGPATQLAHENRGLGGLILESPFTSIEDTAGKDWYFRIFPLRFLLRTHFDNALKIDSTRVPLLIVSGTADTLTPVTMAKNLFARAHEPKQIYLVSGAGHNDLGRAGQEAVASWVSQWQPPVSH